MHKNNDDSSIFLHFVIKGCRFEPRLRNFNPTNKTKSFNIQIFLKLEALLSKVFGTKFFEGKYTWSEINFIESISGHYNQISHKSIYLELINPRPVKEIYENVYKAAMSVFQVNKWLFLQSSDNHTLNFTNKKYWNEKQICLAVFYVPVIFATFRPL